MPLHHLHRYQCHAQVDAIRILSVNVAKADQQAFLDCEGGRMIAVTYEFYSRYKPGPGWYLVQSDGVLTCFPGGAFEENYHLVRETEERIAC